MIDQKRNGTIKTDAAKIGLLQVPKQEGCLGDDEGEGDRRESNDQRYPCPAAEEKIGSRGAIEKTNKNEDAGEGSRRKKADNIGSSKAFSWGYAHRKRRVGEQEMMQQKRKKR